jgi:hypothetical protein
MLILLGLLLVLLFFGLGFTLHALWDSRHCPVCGLAYWPGHRQRRERRPEPLLPLVAAAGPGSGESESGTGPMDVTAGESDQARRSELIASTERPSQVDSPRLTRR